MEAAPSLPDTTCQDIRKNLSCEATVGELVECLLEITTTMQAVVDRDLCGKLDARSGYELVREVMGRPQGEKCAALVKTCMPG